MRTTVTIPDELVAQIDALASQAKITTRNQLIVEALQSWVDRKKEELIDAEFDSMAEDDEYIAETLAIESEFAFTDKEVTTLYDE